MKCIQIVSYVDDAMRSVRNDAAAAAQVQCYHAYGGNMKELGPKGKGSRALVHIRKHRARPPCQLIDRQSKHLLLVAIILNPPGNMVPSQPQSDVVVGLSVQQTIGSSLQSGSCGLSKLLTPCRWAVSKASVETVFRLNQGHRDGPSKCCVILQGDTFFGDWRSGSDPFGGGDGEAFDRNQ